MISIIDCVYFFLARLLEQNEGAGSSIREKVAPDDPGGHAAGLPCGQPQLVWRARLFWWDLGPRGVALGKCRAQEPGALWVLLGPMEDSILSASSCFLEKKKKWLQDLGLSKLPDSLLPEGRYSLLWNGWWSAFSKGVIQDQRILWQEEPPREPGRSPWFAEQPPGATCWASLSQAVCSSARGERFLYFLERPKTLPFGKVFLPRKSDCALTSFSPSLFIYNVAIFTLYHFILLLYIFYS